MPTIYATLLWKVIFPIALDLLKRCGAINVVEEHAAKAAVAIEQTVANLKVTAEYPNPKKTPSAQGWRGADR